MLSFSLCFTAQGYVCSRNLSQWCLVEQGSRPLEGKVHGLWASSPSTAYLGLCSTWCDRNTQCKHDQRDLPLGHCREWELFISKHHVKEGAPCKSVEDCSEAKRNVVSLRPGCGAPSLGGDRIMNNFLVFQLTGQWVVHWPIYLQM